MVKKLVNIILAAWITISLQGQISPVTDQYILNPMSINPAFTGNRGALNFAAFYRHQWVGVTGAPETFTLAIDAPLLDAKLGLGLIIISDKIGVTKENTYKTNYSYKINFEKGILSLGLGAGIITTNTAWSELTVLDQGDDFYLSDSRVFVVPDFSFGVYFSNQKYFAGLSIPKLLEYNFDYNKNKYTTKIKPADYYYLFNTGYLFDISSKTKFLPSTLISFSPGMKLQYDINAYLGLFDKLWIGASYRNNPSFYGFFQYKINTQLKLAYSYNYDFGKLSSYSNGSHEIMLRYEFRYKIEVVNPLIF